jgi:serine/threonine-protein kinase SRPK3
LLGDEEAKV